MFGFFYTFTFQKSQNETIYYRFFIDFKIKLYILSFYLNKITLGKTLQFCREFNFLQYDTEFVHKIKVQIFFF